MATKWKYADIDAENRLEMLRNGNKELFLEETARTKEITDARRALGLDTSEQEKWMDTVGRNYNQSLASEGDTVSTKGYAELYLGEKKQDTEPSPVNVTVFPRSSIQYPSRTSISLEYAAPQAESNNSTARSIAAILADFILIFQHSCNPFMFYYNKFSKKQQGKGFFALPILPVLRSPQTSLSPQP